MDAKYLAELGAALRGSARDAHQGDLPHIDIAYLFLRDNPECFGEEDWPADMPEDPPAELVIAYYGGDLKAALDAAADTGDAIALFALNEASQ